MSADYRNICATLYREAHLLDDRQQGARLECYAEGVTHWMPAQDDDNQLANDPHSQIPLMYYANCYELEDRVFRIKTECNGTSMPELRTSHTVTNVEILAERGGEVDVRYNFHTLSHRYKTTDHFFGTMFVTLRRAGDGFLIASKRIVLKSDYIRQVLDVYHV